MSSPLDNRIKAAAEQAVTNILGASKAPAGGNVAPAELQAQMTDLHEHMHHVAATLKRLKDRIDALESGSPAAPDQGEQGAPRRGRRKTAEQ